MEEYELNPEQKKALYGLRDEYDVPPDLENKTVQKLRAMKLIADTSASRPKYIGWMTGIAAGILLITTGFFVGQRNSSPNDYTHILLLYEDENFTSNPTQFEEYGMWTRQIKERGIDITGEKLNDEFKWIGQSEVTEQKIALVTGYFLLKSKSMEEAISIAENCPHAKYGGEIEIRALYK